MNKLKEMNGKYYQECEVVMLATDKKATRIIKFGNQLRTTSEGLSSMVYYSQHLYFLSNEEIKEEDWCLVTKSYKDLLKNDIFRYNGEYSINPDCIKKIIATTDLSLTIIDYTDCKYPLPQPSKEFIKAYIKAYNKSKPITKVLVEVEKSICDNCKGEGYLPDNIPMYGAKRVCEACMGKGLSSTFKLKINSSNEITIKKIKDSWTREEHCTDMQYYMEYCERNGYVTPMEWLDKLKHY